MVESGHVDRNYVVFIRTANGHDLGDREAKVDINSKILRKWESRFFIGS